MNTVHCHLHWEDDMYQRKETIQIKYKKKTVQKMIYKETFSSDREDIIALKKDEYLKENYEVNSHKKELTARKVEAVEEEYKKVIGKLTDEGYTCK